MVRHAPSPAYKKYCTKGLDTPRGFCYTSPMANFEDNLTMSGGLDNEVLPSMRNNHCSDGTVHGKALEESSWRDQRIVLESRIKELTIRCEQAQAREKVLRAEKTDWKAQARGAQGIQKQTSRKLEETRKVLKEERKTAKKALWMKSEIVRLKGLLEQASIDPGLLLTGRTLRLKYSQLKKDLKKSRVLNYGLKQDLKKARASNHGLKQDLVNLRVEISTLERMLFGQSSEKHRPNTEQCGGSKGDEPGKDTEADKPTGGKRRGQHPNSKGHGRTDHSNLEERVEKSDPPKDQRQCACCGKAYLRNGYVDFKTIELAFQVWKRVVRRSRWVPACDCPASVDSPGNPRREVIAPKPTRLFDKSPYGFSVWSWFLVEVYGYYRPVSRTSAWLKERGAPISAGTLSGSIKRMTPLFLPVYNALRQRLTDSRICQGDETSWRVQSLPGRGKAWLWVGLNPDCVVFRVDPSRSAKAALKLFGELKPGTILVCDRYAAYSALVKLLGGGILLAICWVHARRDIVRCIDAHKTLQSWGDAWLDRYGKLFHLNKQRLKHYQPGRGLCEQSKAFHKAHQKLTRKVDAFFDLAGKQLEKYSGKDPRIRPLKALIKYREGLCIFLEHPEVPMDNNGSEEILRGPSIGRKLSFGSNSQGGADFTAMMYSLFTTLRRHRLDIRKWLTEWLEACAVNGRTPPEDLDPWLPWTMTAERRAHFALDSSPLEPP